MSKHVYALAAVIGAVAFAASMGWDALDPSRLDWIFLGGIDTSMQFLGWHMFRYEDWTWPLGATPSYGYPVGTSVALTDSIPVFALLFKALSPLLPPDFQYLGLWLLVCFVLQGVFGALLVRRCTASVTIQLLGAGLFVLSPLMIHRAAHAAPTAHWLLLASLWLYFDGKTGPIALVRWLGVVAFAAATHAYLTAMVLALAFAAVVRDGLRQPSHILTRTLLPSAGFVGAAVLVWWATGYLIVRGSDLEALGFGANSMNALSPFMPLGLSALFGSGPFVLAEPSQAEGFAYFGAGPWFLLLVAAVTVRPRWAVLQRWMLANAPFLVTCAVLTLFALSPRVTVGAQTVLEYSPRWWGPLTVFRASGRMFWPVYYALIFAALVAVATRFERRHAAALIVTAVVLQAVDINQMYAASRRSHAERMPVMPFADPFWGVAVPHYKRLVLHPTNMCTPRQNEAVDYRFLMLRAAVAHVSINSGFAARHDAQKLRDYCDALADDIKAGRVADDSLWVVFPRYAAEIMAASPQPLLCTLVDAHAACFTQASYVRWQAQFDVVRRGFVAEGELRDFRQTLEAEYHDRMGRPSTPAPASIDDRLRGLVGYLAYRSRGCGHDEALAIVLGEARRENPLRVCSRQTLVPTVLPPRNETMAFRTAFDAVLQTAQPGRAEPTHVDAEGEVAWVQDYAEERLRGRGHRDATDAVLARIRAIAP